MPLERVSQAFKDTGTTFQHNPLNGDLLVVKNATAIARSLKNLIFTHPSERFFNPNLGSGVSRLVFEPLDTLSTDVVEDEIKRTIENFEPRVTLLSVRAKPDFDKNELNITIKYRIIGIDVPAQELAFALQQSR